MPFEIYQEPFDYHIQRWSTDTNSLGSWSMLCTNGTPADRKRLSIPLSRSFKLAGEAVCHDQPAQVHGAYNSGIEAADWIVDSIKADGITNDGNHRDIVIAGAGMSGISCAHALMKYLVANDITNFGIILLESRDRLGGRVHSITKNGVTFDCGGTWLQNFGENALAPIAQDIGLTFVHTDFNDAIIAAKTNDGSSVTLNDALLGMKLIHDEWKRFKDTETVDINFTEAMNLYLSSPDRTDHEKRCVNLALADVNTDCGLSFSENSFKSHLEEPGVGNGDCFVKEGYSAVWKALVKDLELESNLVTIHLNTTVTSIDWIGSDSDVTKITTSSSSPSLSTLSPRFFVCSIPIDCLKKQVNVSPPFDSDFKHSLDHIKIGVCDKVILQFHHRWWPHNPHNNMLRWYGDEDEGFGKCFTDILDMTDAFPDGSPTLMMFIVGPENIERFVKGKSDEDIVAMAYDNLCQLTRTYNMNN